MLLKVGLAMVLLSLALAIGVSIVVIGLRSEASETTSPSSAKPQTAEKTPEKKEINPGEKLQIDHSSDDGSGKQSGPTPGSSSDSIPDWPGPSNEELASTDGPRYFDPNPGAIMTLTVPALGLYDVPVFSSDNLQALDDSLMHVPETSLPWDGGAQRNVYIAGHYLGWPGTASRLVFYNLDKLKSRDE